MSNPDSLLLSGFGQPFVNSSITFNLTSAVPPSFTLGCISTSGPPTVVTWTRDGSPLPMDSNQVLTPTLVNSVRATYYNNLTVNGILPGLYRCTVTSIKPVIGERLSASQEVNIDGKYNQYNSTGMCFSVLFPVVLLYSLVHRPLSDLSCSSRDRFFSMAVR